jgi:hypothetical protein
MAGRQPNEIFRRTHLTRFIAADPSKTNVTLQLAGVDSFDSNQVAQMCDRANVTHTEAHKKIRKSARDHL